MKTILSMSMLSLLMTTGSAHAVNLYQKDGTTFDIEGSIRIMLETTDKNEPGKQSTHLKDESSRIGFAIAHELGNDMKGIGYLEYGVDTQAAENKFELENRLGYVGIEKANVGEISVGRILSPFDDVSASDYTYEYGGVLDFGDEYIGRSTGSSDEGKNDFIGRVSKSVKIMSTEVNGISAGGSYTLQNGTDVNDIDNAYTLAAFYRSDFGMKLAAGYGAAKGNGANDGTTQDYKGTTEKIKALKEEIWGVSAEYEIDKLNLSFAVDYGQLRFKNANKRSKNEYKKIKGTPKANLLGLGSNWDWGKGNIYAGYYLKDGNKDAKDWKEQRYVVGSDYEFTKRVVTWVEVAREESDSTVDDAKVNHLAGAGLRVYF